jgi:hypothetical protein
MTYQHLYCALLTDDINSCVFSERANPVYDKRRIIEGSNINKSLLTLGTVIKCLGKAYICLVQVHKFSPWRMQVMSETEEL